MASSSSRKRKGKSAQNYDNVAKFKFLFHEGHYHRYTRFRKVLPEARIEVDAPEFAPMKAQINLRKWQRLTKPIQVVGYSLLREFYAIQAVGYSLVREFYSNAWIRDEEKNQPLSYNTFIRGHDIIFSPEEIHKVLNLRSKPIPNVISYHDRKEQNDLRLDNVLRDLCIEGAQWVLHDDGRHHFLRRTDLKPMARGWYKLDEIIAEQIYKFVNKPGIRTKLPFPGVIQRLCNEAKVSIPEDTMIPVAPHIKLK
ncbi:hypothetical protein PIB30_045390 [Stylosanthes scabra]|uniref:Putative plant transposon protein domain-containing protein n=1 Tax=Stylosanthes scabra TaxID=79078 RepID=A0ABU6VFG4_9FABA|nr:hypothetical protein [Stylosanthes scabra]